MLDKPPTDDQFTSPLLEAYNRNRIHDSPIKAEQEGTKQKLQEDVWQDVATKDIDPEGTIAITGGKCSEAAYHEFARLLQSLSKFFANDDESQISSDELARRDRIGEEIAITAYLGAKDGRLSGITLLIVSKDPTKEAFSNPDTAAARPGVKKTKMRKPAYP